MVEESTTDTNGEFSSMLAAQQAYSASAQVITAVNKMFDTLISAVR
jgi:flagellar hook protein FlgE